MGEGDTRVNIDARGFIVGTGGAAATRHGSPGHIVPVIDPSGSVVGEATLQSVIECQDARRPLAYRGV